MLVAGKLSIEYSGLKNEDFELLQETIQSLPLPILPEFDPKALLNIIQNDKKIKNGKIHFILLKEIGETIVNNNLNEGSIINALEIL